MKRVFFGTRNMLVPGHWNELDRDGLLYVAKLLSGEYTRQEIVVALTSYYSGLSLKELEQYNPLIFSNIEHQFDWIWKDVKLRRQLIPEIRLGMRKYIGPKEGLADFTFERFIIFSETYFDEFLKSNDEIWLDRLIGTLYVRERFDCDEIEDNAKRLGKLSREYKTAILLFYQGSRNYIATRFPQLFRKKKNAKGEQEVNFLQVIEMLNGGDISKNNEIREVNIYEVFTRLVNMMRERKR